MFLGVPGIGKVASGMTQSGQRMSFTVFESQAQLEAARSIICARLADMDDRRGQLLEASAIARPITEAEYVAQLLLSLPLCQHNDLSGTWQVGTGCRLP